MPGALENNSLVANHLSLPKIHCSDCIDNSLAFFRNFVKMEPETTPLTPPKVVVLANIQYNVFLRGIAVTRIRWFK